MPNLREMPADDAPRSQREIDEALDRSMNAPAASKVEDKPLKKLWDQDLEAELEAALEGFDPDFMAVSAPGRTRTSDRSHVPQQARGQEAAPGVKQGKVVAIRGNDIFVDIGGKSEGVLPVSQFDENDALPAVGSMVEVTVDRYDPKLGMTVLSRKGAAVDANWENLKKGLVVEAKVTKVLTAGLEVSVNGIRGFMPISQVEIGRVETLDPYLNQKLKVLVTEANPGQRNLVVSRRDLLEKERAEQREKTWAELQEGQIRKGVVRSIREFGAFVDLGGVDGLLHISDMAWSRGAKAEDVVRLNDTVEVKVLKIDRATQKVSLGLKQLAPSPWDTLPMRLKRGQTVSGTVTKLMEFGAFVELEPGVEGLIHISELAPKRVTRVSDIVKEKQEVEVRILNIDLEQKRIGLSLLPNAPEEPEEPESTDDGTPARPRPERKVPLKGGLGDRDPNPFGKTTEA